MANINKIQLPNGTQYDIEDAVARANIVNTLSALSDTTITSPIDGQVLTYDGTTGKWVNATADASFNVQIVQTLPTTNIDTHTIYFVPVPAAVVGTAQVGSSAVGSENDVYDEYMYINNQWEKIGDTRIDLSGYATEDYVDNTIVQSDWIEEDTTSLAHVLNRPAIRAGEGENSIIEGQIEQDDDAAEYTLTISGAASATTFTYTTTDTLPTSSNLKTYAIASYPYSSSTTYYRKVESIDSTNLTITLDSKLSPSAITNGTLTIYYKYKNAVGKNSHAEGQMTNACGFHSHAEGVRTNALGNNGSHAEGSGTAATGPYSHAEGSITRASGNGSHAEGYSTVAIGTYSHAEGYDTKATGARSHAEGYSTTASNNQAHAEGINTSASGDTSHAEGVGGVASGFGTHVEGYYATKSGITLIGEAGALTYTTVEGKRPKFRNANQAVGCRVSTNNNWSNNNPIIQSVTLVDGEATSITLDKTLNANEAVSADYYIEYINKSTFNASHAEGGGTYATGGMSHAEGDFTWSSGHYSHAEGSDTIASGTQSHAEGGSTIAQGASSHAEGAYTKTIAAGSHTEGFHTIAQRQVQHVSGRYNIPDTGGEYGVDGYGDYAVIIGNGDDEENRSNAHTLDWSGNAWYAGKVSAGTVASPAAVTNANDLTTKAYVDATIGGSTLSGLSDTTITSPSNGQVLTYNNTSSKWENANLPSIPTASTTLPVVDGTAAIGSSSAYAKADHVHPTDTSRAPVNSPALTGTPTAPTATAGTNTTQIATTQFVNSAVSSALTSVMTYKGTKATVAALPSSGNAVGDVWHVTANGSEYAWDGSTWQELGTSDKEVMVITITGEEDQQTGDLVYSADKTFAEIYAHLNAGNEAFCKSDSSIYLLRQYDAHEIIFTEALLFGNDIYGTIVTIRENEILLQGYATTVPQASQVTPSADGTGSTGLSIAYARADHIHPSDSTKANVSDVLTKTNTTAFTPTADYHPATKAYVDTHAGASSLSGLTDTTISSPSNGQILTYDSTTSKWTNSNQPNIPSASSTTPVMDGTASVGSSSNYARADHVHPSDTTKANVSDVLTKTNTTAFTPTADYQPATKKYVDDHSSSGGNNPTLDLVWEDVYSDWQAGYYYDPDNDFAYTQIPSTETAWGVTELYISTSCTPYNSMIPVVPGEEWRYLNMPIHFDSKNKEVPSIIIFDSNKSVLISYTRTFQDEYTVFTIPANGAWMAVLYANSQTYVLQKHVDKSYDEKEVLDNIMADYRAYSLAPPPTPNTLTKGYICIGTDDLRPWETKNLHTLFTTNSIPYYMAAIPDNIKACITDDPYKTNLDYMRLCVQNGGEIICHSGPVITAANENDFNTMYTYFAKNKRQLEHYGFNVRGIFKAGGEGAIYDPSDSIIDAWASHYYEFGDYFRDNFPYNIERTMLEDWEDYTGLAQRIQSIVQNKSYGVFTTHYYNSSLETAISTIKTALSGYVEGTDYEFVTPSELYDLLMPASPTPSGDTNTTYRISMSGNVITLTGSDSSTSSVTLPIYNGSVSAVTGATGGTS